MKWVGSIMLLLLSEIGGLGGLGSP